MRVVLGAHRLQEPEESQQIFSVAESIAHPLYTRGSADNDIRLLQVSLHGAPSGRAVGYPIILGCKREVGCPTALGCEKKKEHPTAVGRRRRWGAPWPRGTGRELECPRSRSTGREDGSRTAPGHREEVGCPTRG